jgi:hypothetical protein
VVAGALVDGRASAEVVGEVEALTSTSALALEWSLDDPPQAARPIVAAARTAPIARCISLVDLHSGRAPVARSVMCAQPSLGRHATPTNGPSGSLSVAISRAHQASYHSA